MMQWPAAFPYCRDHDLVAPLRKIRSVNFSRSGRGGVLVPVAKLVCR